MDVVDLLNGWLESLLSLYIVGNPGMCTVLYRSKRMMLHLQSHIFFLHCIDSLDYECLVSGCH
jgi:hypothetical protein